VGWLAGALWAAVAGLLAWIFVLWGRYGIAVVAYPFGVDISEGAVWQQITRIPGPLMYGDISRFPFLVFEYPPLYHLLVRGIASLGLDVLAVGRSVSLASAVVTFALIGLVAFAAQPNLPRAARVGAGLLAGALPACLLPVIIWSSLMRVDMFGLALTYAGIALGLHAFRRPRALYPALLFFVLACYTKQTFVSAPVAMLTIHALRDIRLALRAGLLGLVVGLAALVALYVATDGGFVLHVFVYNVNRFRLAEAGAKILSWVLSYSILVGIVAAAAVAHAWPWLRTACGRLAALRADPRRAILAFLTLYLVLVTLTLLASGKAGANLNYFLEWMCLWCVWIGVAAGLVFERYGLQSPLAVCLPALLLLQIGPEPGDFHLLYTGHIAPAYAANERHLRAQLQHIDGPILSDDQVILQRAGKGLSPEMPMLAELALNGRWDGQKLLDLINAGAFGAVLTQYDHGTVDFEERYSPAVQTALALHYPQVTRFNDFRLRRPKAPPPP
jgi:hypothetical protein